MGTTFPRTCGGRITKGDDSQEIQREISKGLSESIGEVGFALAGSGAIREHGLIDRATEDVDMFTTASQQTNFGLAVNEGVSKLERLGFAVSVNMKTEAFARLDAEKDGKSTKVELGVDYREKDPVWIDDAGYVLDEEDAVANKICALFSRSEARDYLDALSIKRSGRFTDEYLWEIAANHDPGFSSRLFRDALAGMDSRPDSDFLPYISADELAEDRQEAARWCEDITARLNERDFMAELEEIDSLTIRRHQPREPKGTPHGGRWRR